MNRTAVKNFAQWARRHLHEQARARLALFGITEKGMDAPRRVEGGLISGNQTLSLSPTDLGQYDALVGHYHDLPGTPKDKFNHLTDEIAYTWFNRLAALRFMEVQGYAERALSSDQPGVTDPNLLRDAMTLAAGGELPGVTPDVLDDWQRLYQPGELYRRLLSAYAAALAPTLPFLFEGKAWLNLFLPDTLLNQDSIVRRMVADIPEADWQDIEIVGWLYQFYISERKDEVFAQKGKYTPRDIPAATQLFTPHWIVRYMVENSLGRVWLEAHPESGLKAHMPYYLESENPAPQDSATQPNPDLKPEDLTVMDPACGSGHILVYAFDLLAHIYREQGYSEREIPALILTHNLHGLDIDERAAQLASFAVVMKARELNSRLFRRDMPTLNILQVRPTRGLKLPNAGSRDMLGQYSTLSGGLTDADAFNPNDWQPLVSAFEDADHLGSLITPPAFSAERLRAQLHWLEGRGGLDAAALDDLRHLLKQAELLAKKYDAVVANPPYMANNKFEPPLKSFVEKKYPEVKSDLFSVFIARDLELTKESGQLGFMTPFVWMFISSYEGLRKMIIRKHTISSLVQLEYSGFDGATVPICTFTLKKAHDNEYPAQFIRLSDFRGAENQGPKVLEAVQNPEVNYRYTRRSQSEFENIPEAILAYWASEKIFEAFRNLPPLSSVGKFTKGSDTGDGDRFIRFWHEVGMYKTSIKSNSAGAKWYPLNKGGSYRKWFGNNESIINWGKDGQEIRKFEKSNIRSYVHYFEECLTWTKISSSFLGVRFSPAGFIANDAGPSVFGSYSKPLILSLLCSKLASEFTSLISATMNYTSGVLEKIPYSSSVDRDAVITISERAISLSKTDWDNFETSWDFQTHPLLRHSTPSLPEAFARWEAQSEAAFRELQRLEEENNRYWIEAYGLGDELTPEVPDDQITIRRADLGRDVRSLLSYAVGCMMGRYSLDEPGLIHAGQPFDAGRHTTFAADRDGILPVTTDAYFDDDVTARFREFLRVAFGPETLDANMDWVAASLGGQKAGETAEERIRRYFAAEFMSDHIQTYKKRPIYWLFTSGKKRGFGALVYLHRYDADTLARLRTDYLLPLQGRLEARRGRLVADRDAAGSTAARRQAEKALAALDEQVAEVHKYDTTLQHAANLRPVLDLDDGVAYNYWLMSAAGLSYLTGRAGGAGVTGLQDLVYAGTDLKLADLEKKSQWKRDLLAQEGGV
ncbi:BREX-1 system adenine-specific DNA-methyltransferase PglX [Deinococcus wulumuqiensis]|uniref:site-specific DNA-methyltransferase (adenine-specific) n=1 Tax=Deinococcus wulumuqiensis TaxID=980427 RepID=A0AAV4K7Z3_9DEIO|nr:BREX-1 system adenine-specific DNA-methyltransferase PglX [Deinococcus wulumuqiensis]QII22082.1 BREX-1 system adenine-specific DNA-methyltransferase PglX [Deinococcus wulumuqiensis R12]GGI84336.1 class I SAM-dependent DNA methyltransferase [Deinococcus wulumuqiensis]GGP29773.1 class I SAM-dependent DNA methyltransferase [Deinococcus wulumuqiensis]